MRRVSVSTASPLLRQGRQGQPRGDAHGRLQRAVHLLQAAVGLQGVEARQLLLPRDGTVGHLLRHVPGRLEGLLPGPDRRPCPHELVVSGRLASDGRPDARYLAKNNNNVLRLPMLKQVFPDAVLLIPWRDPLQQALSLLAQHERFCARHDQDRFSLEYMNWLGHFEFGRGHRPFRFSEPVDTANDSPDMPDYWLKLWIATYRHLLTTAPVDAVFICYERLCRDPVAQFRRIASAANIVCDAESYGGLFQEAAARPVDRFSDDVVERAAEVRDELFRRSTENTTDGKPSGNRTG